MAAVLLCTKRTLSSYVNLGVLPQPLRFGRNVGWGLDVLTALLTPEQTPQRQMSDDKRSRLLHAVRDLEALRTDADGEKQEVGISELTGGKQQFLPEPLHLDDSFSPERDLRHFRITELKNYRRLVDDMVRDAKQAPRGSDEKSLRWKEVRGLHSQIEHLEMKIANDFVHLHSPSQFLGSRELFASPIFNVRNHNSPREKQVEFVLTGTENGSVRYEGPELRQDDGLVFMALLNIARDVRVGKSVSFSAQSVCEALLGYYDGSCRPRLKAIISRLQGAFLHFPTFRVQLVQRFDFPQRGLWTVSLDTDIVQLLTKQSAVWLDLHQRLSLTNGLTSWLYGYVRSQTSLIPTKVDRLRKQSGSEGALDGFRESLKTAMGVMSGAQVVDVGWHIDKHDLLHWRKLRS